MIENKKITNENKQQISSVLFKLITTKDFLQKIELAKTLRLYFPTPVNPMASEDINQVSLPGRPDGFKMVHDIQFTPEKYSEYKSQVEYLHVLANIELLAVEITALSLLRFGSQDPDFIRRQLLTISEKAIHFKMLEERLKDFNMYFGVFEATDRFWQYALQCESELELQVFVGCYLEAKRLDLSPGFLKKMIKAKDEKTTRIMKLILAEELKHIKLGMKYFKQKSAELKQDPNDLFKEIIKKVMGHDVKSDVPVNEEYRKLAGFSKDQIDMLKTGA